MEIPKEKNLFFSVKTKIYVGELLKNKFLLIHNKRFPSTKSLSVSKPAAIRVKELQVSLIIKAKTNKIHPFIENIPGLVVC